jgi:hypothetical protein
VRAEARREQLALQDLRSVLRLRPIDPAVMQEAPLRRHCGIWREFEDALGRVIFPTAAEAQAPVPARQDSLRSVSTTAAAAAARPDSVRTPIRMAPVILSSPSDVAEARGNQRQEIRSGNSLGVEIHKKFTISVSCFNFVVIGIALALRFPRGGIGLVLGGSMLIFTLFYVGMTAGEQLADRGFLTPALAMWAPNILIGVLGLIGLWAASKTTGSTRGGDLSDLRDLLFGWLRRRKAQA